MEKKEEQLEERLESNVIDMLDLTTPEIKEAHDTVDKLKMYFGEDIIINDFITLKQPSVNTFIEYGENNIYGAMTLFISNSTAYRLPLWEMKPRIDWTTLSDFEFFMLMARTTNYEFSQLIIPNVDFSTFVPYLNSETKEVCFGDPEGKVMIDEKLYKKISLNLRYMFNTFPKTEIVRGKGAKRDVIFEEQVERKRRAREGTDVNNSSLLPMISFALNHPGFKYKRNELREIGIVEFMDSIQRLQVYEQTSSLMKGIYSGFVDTKKISKDQFNFMRDLTA